MVSKIITGTCYFVGHSHLDAAWLWSFDETKRVFRDTCETVLELMEKHQHFCFCQSSAQYYKWLEERYPETFKKVKKKVEEGRWEIVGGTWVEPDGNLPSGESLVRQFLLGKRYFAEKFGVDVKIAWFPDSFGYAWTLPQIMKKAGVEFFLTQKMLWNDTTVFPYYFFNWKAPDGSFVLAHETVGSYDETVDEPRILEQMKQLNSRHHLNDLLLLFGNGDHGGGVTEDMIERASEFIRGNKPIKGVFSTAKQYLRTVTEKIQKSEIPQINDELYFQFHRGTYTTQARVKKNNRKAECLLETAEKFSTLAHTYGYSYPTEELNEAWQKLLLNQFHDVLPGSSIPEVYRDSEEYFKTIFDKLNRVISESLKTIAAKINTGGEGKSILVFNPLSWLRSDFVEVSTDELGGEFEIHDKTGRIIPSQTTENKKIIFTAENVPPIGYKDYKAKPRGLKRQPPTSLSSEETEGEIKLENEFFIVKIDNETGLVKSMFDKKRNREILQNPGNRIQIFEDYPVRGRTCVNSRIDAAVFDAWEVFIYQQPEGVKYVELDKPLEVKLVEKGPVRTRVRVRYKYAQKGRPDSTFIQEIILSHKVPLVEFKLNIDWHAEHRLAKVAFPLSVHSDFTTYEAPYGFVTRRNPVSPNATLAERSKYEVPGQKWMDHSSEDGDYGVSLLNDCKYGFDTANDTIRMTLLRSAAYPFELRAAFGLPVDKKTLGELTDQGEHHVAYALYPHRSDFLEALTARKAYEFNLPTVPVMEPSHDGHLPKVFSFISAQPENIILTVVKKAEDSDDMILRFFETSSKNTKAVIRLAEAPKSAKETDLMENETSRIPIKEKSVEIPISRHEIKTAKIIMQAQAKHKPTKFPLHSAARQ
jgi:alpha-mannosidase